MQGFFDRLNIKKTEEITPYYYMGLSMYEQMGAAILDPNRIIALNNKYNIFRTWLSDVLKASKAIQKDRDLTLFIYVLYCVLKEKAPLKILSMPNRGCLETDFAPLFSLLYFVEDMASDMKKRGLPFAIISDTLSGFDSEINDYYDRYGRSGMRIYMEWFLLYIYKKLLRIGRFNFEMTTLHADIQVYGKDGQYKIILPDGTEPDAYGEKTNNKPDLTGFCLMLEKGDPILSVHIPSREPLSDKICQASYEKAAKIFTKHYPEFEYKAFCCFSWLMEKRLKDIMGRETNITRFSSKYMSFPIDSDGMGVYYFLFCLNDKIPADQLPENTSMQRAVKKYLKQNEVFYDKGGIFFLK